jgi:hypothetical protein
MSKFLAFILLLFSVLSVSAQKYSTALGVRFGNEHYGITAKQKLLSRTTLEGIFAAYPSQYSSTLLIEQHFPLIGKGFNIYTGVGMHLGEQKEQGNYYGYDAILGAEMKLPGLPIVISADIKPAYEVNHSDWFTFSTGLSAHYIIAKDNKKKRQKAREKRKRKKERQKRREEKAESDNGSGLLKFDLFKKG